MRKKNYYIIQKSIFFLSVPFSCNLQDRKEFEAKLIRRFGSIVKIPLLKPERYKIYLSDWQGSVFSSSLLD